MRVIPHKYACAEAVNSLGGNGDILALRAGEEKRYRPQTNEDARRSPDLCRRAQLGETQRKTRRKKREKPSQPGSDQRFFFPSPFS